MKKPRGRATEVDAHVGGRVRERRTLLGLNQAQLGDALGLTFQQVQKYERGSNRIGASRLYQLSKILDVPVSYFYEGMPVDVGQLPSPKAQSRQDGAAQDTMHKRETLELVRAYYRIDSPQVRDRLREMIRATAGEGSRGRARKVRS